MAERFIIWCRRPVAGAADLLANALAMPGVRIVRAGNDTAVVTMTYDTASRLRRTLPSEFAIEEDVAYHAVGS